MLQFLDRDDRLLFYDIVSGAADYDLARRVAPSLADHNRIGDWNFTYWLWDHEIFSDDVQIHWLFTGPYL